MIGVHKWYGAFHVLRNIDLEVARGERIVVCGPSGSGKSTLIRCVNRLEEHQRGVITVDGVELTADLKRIDAIRRDVGMVFQQFNLFPHLTILENCTLAPIWVRKMPKRDADAGGGFTSDSAWRPHPPSGAFPPQTQSQLRDLYVDYFYRRPGRVLEGRSASKSCRR